jgi:DNA-binding transcriptional LysR family regulator
MREDLETGLSVLKRLAVPHHTLRSWSQVARREHLSDDRITRSLARLTELVGGPLTEVLDNRLVPTALGHEFRSAVERLLALGQGEETIEILTIATAPVVDSLIVARAIIEFSKEWGQLVGFRQVVLPHGIREAVDGEQAAFGIVSVGEGEEADEEMEPPLPVVALIPEGHRLAGASSTLDSEHFSPADRVFFPPTLAVALGDLLCRVPVLSRVPVECPATLRVLVENSAGIGFEYAHPVRRSGDTFSRVPVVGVQPLTLGLVLPRKSDRLTEPARYFLDVLRRSPEIPQPSSLSEHPSIPDSLTA